jgi:hypothetical protein
MKTKPKTMSASKQARIGRDLAGDFVILISGFFMHDLMLTARRMLQEKLKFGGQPTFDRTAWAMLQRLRKFLEANGTRISPFPMNAISRVKAK